MSDTPALFGRTWPVRLIAAPLVEQTPVQRSKETDAQWRSRAMRWRMWAGCELAGTRVDRWHVSEQEHREYVEWTCSLSWTDGRADR